MTHEVKLEKVGESESESRSESYELSVRDGTLPWRYCREDFHYVSGLLRVIFQETWTKGRPETASREVKIFQHQEINNWQGNSAELHDTWGFVLRGHYENGKTLLDNFDAHIKPYLNEADLPEKVREVMGLKKKEATAA